MTFNGEMYPFCRGPMQGARGPERREQRKKGTAKAADVTGWEFFRAI